MSILILDVKDIGMLKYVWVVIYVERISNDVLDILCEKAADSSNMLSLYLFLRKHNIDVSTQISEDGHTILTYCMLFGRYHLLPIFIKLGADVNIQDRYGHTPLMEAVFDDNYNVAEMLLKHGADMHIKKTLNQKSALDFATIMKRTSILELFHRHTKKEKGH